MFNCPFYEIYTVYQKFWSKLSSYGSAVYDLIDACTHCSKKKVGILDNLNI